MAEKSQRFLKVSNRANFLTVCAVQLRLSHVKRDQIKTLLRVSCWKLSRQKQNEGVQLISGGASLQHESHKGRMQALAGAQLKSRFGNGVFNM